MGQQWKTPMVAKSQPYVCKELLITMENTAQLILSVQQTAKLMKSLALTELMQEVVKATLCRAKGTDNDGELCIGVCPPTCGADEILTAGGIDAKGCETAPTCVPII